MKAPVGSPLVQDQLHTLDSTLKMRVEISRQSREQYLILFLCFVAFVADALSEDGSRVEKPMNHLVPVGHVIGARRTLGGEESKVRTRIAVCSRSSRSRVYLLDTHSSTLQIA